MPGVRPHPEATVEEVPGDAAMPAERVVANPQVNRRQLTPEEYVGGTRGRNVAILARTLTLIESQRPDHQRLAEEVLTLLLPSTGHAIRVGITGAPGAGKSTFIEALGLLLIDRGHRVAVLAVDPSSTVTGGSILGDKTRMMRLATNPSAFIRPSPSAGTLGGVARKTREAILILEAAGYDVIIVETVGVGQSETMVSEMTDCLVGLMIPGAGDELQGIKRGLLELVDVIAVNKADGPTKMAAEIAAKQYELALNTLTSRGHQLEAPVVFTCSALQNDGVDRVWQAVAERVRGMEASGRLGEKRSQQNLRWLWAQVDDQLRQAVKHHPRVQAIRTELERKVLANQVTAEAAARRILAAFGLTAHS